MAAVVAQRTPAQEQASRLLDEAIDAAIRGEARYPDDVAFVPADAPWSGQAVKRCKREGWAVLLVFPEGDVELLPRGRHER